MRHFHRSEFTAALLEPATAHLSCAGVSPRAAAPKGALSPVVKTGRLRVLIVEDEMIVAMSLESLVEDFGFEVCAMAATGPEAVTLARALRPDLILMDVNLIGDMDGVEAARQIRETIDARIVFVTAYGSGEVLDRIQSTIPHALVLSKPVVGSALLRAIERTDPQ
ncbi:response regulator [Phenylobacterium sp.]|uniref:response regulator n=1 Tax=Phenylobacterium sp. TaxID=1871053 RepID=UPI002FCA7ACD